MLYTMYVLLTSDEKQPFTGSNWVFHYIIKLVYFLGQNLPSVEMPVLWITLCQGIHCALLPLAKHLHVPAGNNSTALMIILLYRQV